MHTRPWRDVLLALAGILFGATSLTWPFGWDTAVHYYVGREWVLRGAIPYRDTFDHKPPLIHFVHAASVWLFGEGMWGIRVIELACIVVLGWVCASLAVRRGERGPDGLRGASVLTASVLYYGFFDYWNTAQCELLGTTLCALALLAAWRIRRPGRAAVAAGLVTGAVFALKPPLVVMALVPFTVLAIRAAAAARHGGGARTAAVARSAAWLAGSALVIPAVFVAYFAAHGAAADLLDFVVRCNFTYLRDEPRLTTASEVWANVDTMWRCFSPIASLLFVAAAVATADAVFRRSRGRLARWATAWALLAASVLAVAIQLKFYFYHWITPLSAVVLLAANLMVDVSHAVRASRRAWVPPAAAVVLLAAFSRTGIEFDAFLRTSAATLHWWSGDWDRARFARTFQTWDGLRRYGDFEATGLWLREHSSAGDFVLVRGIAAEIYVVSGRRAPGRFFWTAFLTRPSRRFHREEMLAEDYDTIVEKRPRWVVTWGPSREGPDSAEWFSSMGYERRQQFGANVVLERKAVDVQVQLGAP